MTPPGVVVRRTLNASWQVAEKPSAVIPGRREAADPESSKAGNPDVLDSGFAPSARPGMTAGVFQQPANCGRCGRARLTAAIAAAHVQLRPLRPRTWASASMRT